MLLGVFINVTDYGGVTGVTYLAADNQVPIWNDLVTILQGMGYQVGMTSIQLNFIRSRLTTSFFLTGKNLRAAPYDWRKGPLEWNRFEWPQLKRLIEETYEINGNMPVTFVSLSMGGPYFLSFLNNFVSQTWKVILDTLFFFLISENEYRIPMSEPFIRGMAPLGARPRHS